MVFIETSFFTEDVTSLLSEEEYRNFQNFLAENPEAGDLIKDTGGLRKVRWGSGGKGKSGGVRVIYYYVVADSQLRMILVYKKGIQDTLTDKQKATLRKLNERWE